MVGVCFMLPLSMFIATTLAGTSEDVKYLLSDIFTAGSYDKRIRPIRDQDDAITVQIDFFLNSVIDFDEKTESLKTAGFLTLNWTDENFQWLPEFYNYTEYVLVPQDDIWKPDISLKNTFKSFTGLGSSYLNVYVESDGRVTWNPFQVLDSTCSVSITYFPFDTQACTLRFSAWSYTPKEVNLKKGHKGIRLIEYSPSALWDVVDTSDGENDSEEASVVFQIMLKRKPKYFVMNIIIPVMLLSLLNIFSFVLPATSGERAGYSITVFLSLAVFLTIVSEQLPKNSENTSLLAVYIMLITGLSTAIVLVCMIQLRLQSWNEEQMIVTKFFRNFVSIHDCLRCRNCSKRTVTPTDKAPSDTQLEDHNDWLSEVTWIDVVKAMDCIFSTASILYTCICTLIIGVLAVHSSD